MSDRATYKKVDIVDYFAAKDSISEAEIDTFLAEPGRRVILSYFVEGQAWLSKASVFIDRQFRISGWRTEALLRQLARRCELPISDSRHITVADDAARSLYRSSLPDPSAEPWRPTNAEVRYPLLNVTEAWGMVKRRDQLEYMAYWRLAYSEEYGALLSDRRLLATIDAFNRRKNVMEVHDHVLEIEDLAAHRMPSLDRDLGSFVLGQLSASIRWGLIEVPDDLQAEMPEVYAARGIL